MLWQSPMREGSTLSFGLQLQPQSRMVSRMVLIVRRFVEESVEKSFDESFENLVGDPESDGLAARISLTNQSAPEHIARLRASIEEIQSSTEPAALYQTPARMHARG
jgi:predicted ATP-binding protein involved in virulence